MYSHETKSYAAPTKTGGYRLFYDGVEANSVRPQAREIHVCLHKDQTQAAIIAPIRQGEMKMRQALVVVDYQRILLTAALGFHGRQRLRMPSAPKLRRIMPKIKP